MWTVYKHTNKINRCAYIGITSRKPEDRWKNGEGYLDKDSKYLSKFGNAIKKYGWDSFYHEVLYSNLSKEEAEKLEISLIAEYKSLNLSYNISDGGLAIKGMLGKKHTKETIDKIKNSCKGKTSWNKGKHLSEDHKKHISISNTGKKHTDEQKKKNSERQKGKHLSEDHKKHISESLIGIKRNPFTEEHRKKLSESHIGKTTGPFSEERKRKISLAKLGKKHKPLSDVGRHNLSIAIKKSSYKQYKKYKTLDGEIVIMRASLASRYHPEWIRIE